jgi:hypothetical protein
MTAQASIGSTRFVIEREVGRGGVGIVYRALDQLTGLPVALKVIALPGIDAGEEARFAREGRVLAGLNHPGIVRVIAFGQLDDGLPYIAMEWLEGEDVAQRQRRAPLPLIASLHVAACVAEALAAAHAAGIIHRDVKPSNIILAGSGPMMMAPYQVKLVDFGVASAEDVKLTRTGAIVGTPAYMAPEQARGETEIDYRADLYALGATLFEMITGRPPHIGPTAVAILARLVTTPPPRLSDIFADTPQGLDELMARLLATNPADRPTSAADVAAELRGLLDVVAEGTGQRTKPSPSPLLSMAPPAQTTLGKGGTRLVTTIVATHVPKGAPRTRLLTYLRARGADATELGGDAVVAHLGATRAIGDEATRALSLGLRIAKLNAAVGVATGRCRVERTRPQGEVVDRAAALARDARRSQVLADPATSELVRGEYLLQARSDGSCVVGTPLAGKRETTGAPFVGREAELALLMQAFERSVDDKTPVVATISGPPGIGKTRLREEGLRLIVVSSSAPRIAFARGEPFARSHALGVVAELTRGLAGAAKGVSLSDALDATDGLLAVSEVVCSDAARDLIARLLANVPLPSLDAERGARDALWLALTDIAVGLASRTPLVLELEDAQWADAESLAWLEHLLARAGGRPLLVVATARPSLWREDPKRFEARDHVRIELRPLSRRAVRAIATALLGSRGRGDAGATLAESIATQAAGSPLFAEELARLAAQGRDATSAPTIEAAMQVHLDSLDDRGREATVSLAVFGPIGWDTGLAALGVDRAADALEGLAAAEVLVEQPISRFLGAREWAFKHVIMREVAYASLGDEALQRLHARAGHWLAGFGEDDATVARHLELGGESVASAGFLEKAARRALAANALSDAVSLAERAMAFADDKPTQFARAQLLDEAWSRLDARAGERETALRAMQDAVYDAPSGVRARGAQVRYEDVCGGNEETSTRLEEVRREAQAAGIADEEARCAASLAARYAFAGELDAAARVADDLLELAGRHAIAAAAVDAWQTRAVVRQARGEVGAALEARQAAARAARLAGLKTREATLTMNVGFALTTVGAKAEARAAIESGIALAEAIGSPGTERHGKMVLLCWASTFGSDPSADARLTEPRGLADAALSGSWVPHDRATLGVLFYRGAELLRIPTQEAAKQAKTLLRIAAQGYRATKMLDVLPVALGLWAEAERRSGQPLSARELAEEAAELLQHGSPSLLNEAPVFLALHDACLDLGDHDGARQAIESSLPRLVTRVAGLVNTPYVRGFLDDISANAGLLTAAEAYGLVPPELQSARGGPNPRSKPNPS